MGIAIVAIVVVALLTILFYHAKTGVPPVPSTRQEIEAAIDLLREARIEERAIIYELGCGWGSLVLGLARAFPEATIIGYEISPLPYLISKFRTRRLAAVSIRRRDYRTASLADADAVTAYLMIKPMEPLALQLDRSLRPGTPVVTLCFSFRDRASIRAIQFRGLAGEAALYRWPAQVPGN